MKNRKKALIIAIICLAAAAVLYLLVVKLSQRSEDADSSDAVSYTHLPESCRLRNMAHTQHLICLMSFL